MLEPPYTPGPVKVFHAIEELAEFSAPLTVAIGVFDGIHLGHQALIRRAMEGAFRRGGKAVVLTFHPHPAKVLRPELAPRLLTSSPHRGRLVRALGVPCMLEVTFDKAFAAQPPEEFIRALHRHAPTLAEICVGHQWAFGKNRAGDVPLLRRLGAELGFEVTEIEPVLEDGEPVSSTRIRRAVETGDLGLAAKLLGRPHTVLGTVVRGARLGTELGFPTANLAAHNEQFPPDGVYAVMTELDGVLLPGVANIGMRPTVSKETHRVLEVHLLDFSADIYGKDIEVEFIKHLRSEQRFSGLEALRERIARDVAEAREVLARSREGRLMPKK